MWSYTSCVQTERVRSSEIEAIFCLVLGVASQRAVIRNNYPDSAIQLSYCIMLLLGAVN